MTDFNINIGLVFYLIGVCAFLIGHMTLSNAGVKVYLLPQQLYVLSHCPTLESDSGLGPEQRSNAKGKFMNMNNLKLHCTIPGI